MNKENTAELNAGNSTKSKYIVQYVQNERVIFPIHGENLNPENPIKVSKKETFTGIGFDSEDDVSKWVSKRHNSVYRIKQWTKDENGNERYNGERTYQCGMEIDWQDVADFPHQVLFWSQDDNDRIIIEVKYKDDYDMYTYHEEFTYVIECRGGR